MSRGFLIAFLAGAFVFAFTILPATLHPSQPMGLSDGARAATYGKIEWNYRKRPPSCRHKSPSGRLCGGRLKTRH